jgi:hypothetical protein
MSELSPEARGLVDDGHSVLRPSSSDRARVKSALAARLGGAAFLLPQQASAAIPKALVSWQKLSTLVVGASVGLAGVGTAYFMARAPSDPLQDAPATTPAVTSKAQLPPAPVGADLPASPELDPLVLEPVPSPPRRQTPADRLAEEVAILSKATSELRAGRPNQGLRLLEEHQRKFPNGRLAEERRAARIQALCALGHLAAAEAELGRLAQSSPRSPHLARAQRACGIKQ